MHESPQESRSYQRACLATENFAAATAEAQQLCEKDRAPGYRCVAGNCRTTIFSPGREPKLIGGARPLATTLNVDDESIPLEIAIDFTGIFLNFAPSASSIESKSFAQCVEGANQTPIVLDASASFDIDGTIPPGSYTWYEDYGLSTARLWGNGKQVAIPPSQLGFGVHRMTLEVRDLANVPCTGTFNVTVADTQPPLFTSLPGDSFAIATKHGRVKVPIGQATAVDGCLTGIVMISNDAPKSFEAGVATPVTWKAARIHLRNAAGTD